MILYLGPPLTIQDPNFILYNYQPYFILHYIIRASQSFCTKSFSNCQTTMIMASSGEVLVRISKQYNRCLQFCISSINYKDLFLHVRIIISNFTFIRISKRDWILVWYLPKYCKISLIWSSILFFQNLLIVFR